MTMKRATLEIPVPANVVLVGQPKVTMICKSGHIDELAAPMAFLLPPNLGDAKPIVIPVCRICAGQFWSQMQARPATPEELAEIAKAKAEEDAKKEV